MKVKTIVDENVQKELTANLRKLSLIALIVGAVGTAAYIALTVTNILGDNVFFFAVPFIALFTVGFIFTLSLRKTLKKPRKDDLTIEGELFDDYILLRDFKNGAKIAEVKVFYKDLVLWKETESYIFLYTTKFTAVPITKDGSADFLREKLTANHIKKNKI